MAMFKMQNTPQKQPSVTHEHDELNAKLHKMNETMLRLEGEGATFATCIIIRRKWGGTNNKQCLLLVGLDFRK